jgi:hypothetical protein
MYNVFFRKTFYRKQTPTKKRKKKVMGGGFGRSLCYRLAFSMGRVGPNQGKVYRWKTQIVKLVVYGLY